MTASTRAQHIGELLSELADRVPQDKPELSPAVGVVSDIARLAAAGTREDLSYVLARVAGVRDTFADGHQPPAVVLDGPQSHGYLAAVLWTLSVALEARLATFDAQQRAEADRSTSGALRRVIVEVLTLRAVATPSDFLAEAETRHVQATRDQVSKALADLLRDATVEAAAAPNDGDRRNRYFALSAAAAKKTRADKSAATKTPTKTPTKTSAKKAARPRRKTRLTVTAAHDPVVKASAAAARSAKVAAAAPRTANAAAATAAR